MTDLEQQIREVLGAWCECQDDDQYTHRVRGCRHLPKRIAAAIEAATYSIMSTKDDITNVALRALKGEP